MADQILSNSNAESTSKPLSFTLPWHGRPSVASDHPPPGTCRQLKQEMHCFQSWGKEHHCLKSLCYLTGKPKSSPQAPLHLQSIPTGRRAGHSCHLSILHCCKTTGDPQGWEGQKNLLSDTRYPTNHILWESREHWVLGSPLLQATGQEKIQKATVMASEQPAQAHNDAPWGKPD